MQLNKIFEYSAYAIGGTALFTASLLVFALAAGVPAHQVAIIGGMFPEPPAVEPAAITDEDGEVTRPKIGPRTMDEVIESAIGRLPSHGVDSPFEAAELEQLVADMKLLKLQYSKNIEGLEDREQAVTERALALDERNNVLDEFMAQLDQREGEIDLKQEELQRDQAVRAEEDTERWKAVSMVFKGGDAKELVVKLLKYGPVDGAQILAHLEESERNALLLELDADPFKEFNDAYSALAKQ